MSKNSFSPTIMKNQNIKKKLFSPDRALHIKETLVKAKKIKRNKILQED